MPPGFQTYASSTAEGGLLGAVQAKGSGAGNYSSASTSYVNIDGANLSVTMTIPKGFVALLSASGEFASLTAAVGVGIGFADGGTLLNEITPTGGAAGVFLPFGIGPVVVKGDGATHVFTMQYKTSNAADSVSIANSSVTRLPLFVVELTQSNF